METNKLELGRPVITDFRRKDLGNGYVIFRTQVEELTDTSDNTGVVDAQLRALEGALARLKQQARLDG